MGKHFKTDYWAGQHCCLIARRPLVRLHARVPSEWDLNVLPVTVWVLSGFSVYLPQSKNMSVYVSECECFFLSLWPCDEVAASPGRFLPSSQDSWERRPQGGLWRRNRHLSQFAPVTKGTVTSSAFQNLLTNEQGTEAKTELTVWTITH